MIPHHLYPNRLRPSCGRTTPFINRGAGGTRNDGGSWLQHDIGSLPVRVSQAPVRSESPSTGDADGVRHDGERVRSLVRRFLGMTMRSSFGCRTESFDRGEETYFACAFPFGFAGGGAMAFYDEPYLVHPYSM